jgi:hypothetical protein
VLIVGIHNINLAPQGDFSMASKRRLGFVNGAPGAGAAGCAGALAAVQKKSVFYLSKPLTPTAPLGSLAPESLIDR